MLWYIALILAVGGLFYLVVPGVGAFLVRGQWRVFRLRVLEVSHFPMANPRAWRREKGTFVGNFRFFGALEAIQGDDRIWVTNGQYSVAADLRGTSVYIIPAASSDSEGVEAEVRVVPWSGVSSLPEGSTILIGGALFLEKGSAVFRADRGRNPLVVIYDCKKEQIVQRAIWSGRQKNEYWNQFTVPSILSGSFLLLLLAYVFISSTGLRLASLAALTVALAPLAPFLPPAFPLYFLYRSFWKRARLMRAQRDVIRLPLRYFPTPWHAEENGHPERRATLLPDLEPYVMLRGTRVDGDNAAILCGGDRVKLAAAARQIEVSLPERLKSRVAWVYAFGSYREDGDTAELCVPDDPMAELILIPGDPESISRECRSVDRVFFWASSVTIGANIVIGMACVFLLLTQLIP